MLEVFLRFFRRLSFFRGVCFGFSIRVGLGVVFLGFFNLFFCVFVGKNEIK